MRLRGRYIGNLVTLSGLAVVAFLFQNCAQDYKLDSGSVYMKANSIKNVSNDDLTDEPGNSDDIDGESINTPEGKEPLNDDDIAGINECEDAQSKLDQIPQIEIGQSIQNLSGSNIFKIQNLKFVGNISGKLILIGLDQNSHIEEFGNVSGKTILCGVSVDHLSNRSGATWVYNGSIMNLENASGNIRVYGGNIGTLSNVSGTIIQE